MFTGIIEEIGEIVTLDDGKDFRTVKVKAGKILDYLESGQPVGAAEEARKTYVGASRAQRLLAIAIPNSRADRMTALLRSGDEPVEIVKLTL